MIYAEKIKFIDEELKGLWPDWTPTPEETAAWMGILNDFDYDTARTAIKAHWASEKMILRRPKPSYFIEKAKALKDKSRYGDTQNKREITTTVYLECIEAPPERPSRKGWRVPVYVLPSEKQSDIDYVLAVAGSMQRKHKEIYGGDWIVIQEEPSEHHDDGLRGAAAKERAEEIILAGPDTPGKRFLLEVRAGKRKGMLKGTLKNVSGMLKNKQAG